MKTSYIILLAFSVSMWHCSRKEEKTKASVSTNATAQETPPAEASVEIPLGRAKADEYTEESRVELTETTLVSSLNFEHTFAGSLRKKNGDEILISMYLKAQSGTVQGKYFYEANGDKKDILLEGHIAGDSLILTEYTTQNKTTGRFHGVVIGNDTFEGVWTNPDGKRSLFFKLFFDEMDYEQRKIIGLKADDYAEPAEGEQ